MKAAKGDGVIRKRGIEQSLETLTATVTESLAGSHQEIAPQTKQFCHAQTKPLLKLKVKMNQGKFNIRRQGEEIVHGLKRNNAIADRQKRGGKTPPLFSGDKQNQAPPAVSARTGLGRVLSSSRFMRAMKVVLIPFGQVASHS